MTGELWHLALSAVVPVNNLSGNTFSRFLCVVGCVTGVVLFTEEASEELVWGCDYQQRRVPRK